jgi:proteasome lid subunit RPN8/RPN11
MLQRIQIETRVFALLREFLHTSAPHEACGFLLGIYNEEAAVIKRACAVTNAAARYSSFAIADYERYRIERLARGLDLEIMAVYHSHPSGDGRLSGVDHRCLSYSKLPWVIIYPAPMAIDPESLLAAYAPPAGTPIPVEMRKEEKRY